MVGVPLITFFVLKHYLKPYFEPKEDIYAGLAAVLSVQITLLCIAVYKYSDDFYKVFVSGEGNIPYDPELRAEFKKRMETL